ncbi:MAG: 3'-5' exonuclease [Bacteroidota bacterium]
MFKESISVEELVELPLKSFDGDIVLVETMQMVRVAVKYLSQFRVLGFDTETKPSFQKGQIHKVALLQLATDERAFLFRTQKIGIPDELRQIFSNQAILKAGVAIRDDIKGLQKLAPFRPAGFVELQNHAQDAGIQNIGLKKLCAIVCGFRISKSQQLSNWEAEELTDQQMIYAATDAYVSLKIYQKLIGPEL